MTSEDIANIQIVVSIALFLFPAAELIFKKSDGNLFKRITPIGFACLFIAIVFGLLSRAALKAVHQEQESEKHNADSLRKADKKEIINGIGEAIGKYSLGYDSAKKQLVELKKLIRDSVNRKTTIIQGDNPSITFCYDVGIKSDYVTNDSIGFTINICSYSSGSILKEATVYIMTSNSQSYNIFNDLKFMGKRSFLTKDVSFFKNEGKNQQFFLDKNTSKMKSVVVLLKGRFTDSYGKNLQEIDKVGLLDLITGQFGLVASTFDDDVRGFLKRAGAL